MLRAAVETAHKDEFAHGPFNALNVAFGDTAVGIQQSHMRRETPRDKSAQSSLDQGDAENIAKSRQCVAAAVAAQNQWAIARRALKSDHTIERNFKRRKIHRCRRLAALGQVGMPRPEIKTQRMKRDVQALGFHQHALQTASVTKPTCNLHCLRSSVRFDINRKEQRIDGRRRRIDSRQGKLMPPSTITESTSSAAQRFLRIDQLSK